MFISFKLQFFSSRFSLQILTLFLTAIFSPVQPQPLLSRPLHLSLDFTSYSSISLTSYILVKIILHYISFSRLHLPLSLAKSSLLSCVIALPPSPSFIFLATSFSLFLSRHGLHRSSLNLSHFCLLLFALSLILSFLSLFPLSRFRAISLDSSGVHLLSPYFSRDLTFSLCTFSLLIPVFPLRWPPVFPPFRLFKFISHSLYLSPSSSSVSPLLLHNDRRACYLSPLYQSFSFLLPTFSQPWRVIFVRR